MGKNTNIYRSPINGYILSWKNLPIVNCFDTAFWNKEISSYINILPKCAFFPLMLAVRLRCGRSKTVFNDIVYTMTFALLKLNLSHLPSPPYLLCILNEQYCHKRRKKYYYSMHMLQAYLTCTLDLFQK